jgi:S1-C subfamily serine protease
VLTNYHVVEDAKTIRAEGHEGQVTVVAKDEANDLAVLKLPFKPKGSARFVSDASHIRLGEDVVVFGIP